MVGQQPKTFGFLVWWIQAGHQDWDLCKFFPVAKCSTTQSGKPLTTLVDPITNVLTQHVESYWIRVKIKFNKRMRGVDSNQLPSYIDEFMWCERYGKTTTNRFDNIY